MGPSDNRRVEVVRKKGDVAVDDGEKDDGEGRHHEVEDDVLLLLAGVGLVCKRNQEASSCEYYRGDRDEVVGSLQM